MGLLKVSGIINLNQYWPEGQSDADTTKLKVQVDQNSFMFQSDPAMPSKPTHLFKDAIVVGKIKKKVIDNKNRVTIRLQGIDAPELHYNPSPLSKSVKITDAQRLLFKQHNKKYRQHFGELSTTNLKNFLAQTNNDEIACVVTTVIDEPNEVFDTYGRLVGDIYVDVEGNQKNINQWLVEEGWAFPTFYSSMSLDEMRQLLDATKKGRTKLKIWKYLQKKIGKFDDKLIYEKKSDSPDPKADLGPLILPKVFRRLCTWYVHKKVGTVNTDFLNYLISRRDGCFLRKEFFEQGESASVLHILSDFLKKDGTFDIRPEELIFREAPSRLIGPDGLTINEW
jgi:endonuclease YncB( thermonuclease family)